ncbi:MAG: phosphoribosylglycinamide formyltransferase [Spirochaetaceae bacterium]|nr:phosphoribosylglycinamide formyltransferase [Spirochaetaceae bacterium]
MTGTAGERPLRTGVIASGNGTTLQAIIDAQGARSGVYSVELVLTDRKNAFARERALRAGIPAAEVLTDSSLSREERRKVVSGMVLEYASRNNLDILVLAGSLTIFTDPLITAYSGRIINLHPALLPRFGGPGMYGRHVHEAVLASGETESGCTVHLVDSGCDTGPILLQRRVPVLPGDTPDTLAARVHEAEHTAIIDGIVELSKQFRNRTILF